MSPLADDEQLMQRVRGGDHGAMEALVRRHGAVLLSFVRKMAGGGGGWGEDVFQDVWVTVWAKRATFDATRRFRPWLYRIAASRCADWRRRRARVRLVGGRPGATGPGRDGLEAGEAMDAVDAAIAALPPVQREVVSLRLYASMGYAEIADVLGIAESSARSDMCHALRSLRAALRGLVEREEEARDVRA